MKLKKGDKVRVLAGKDRGREGVVERVFSIQGKVLVTGVNIYKKHTKARGGEKPTSGGIIDLARPLPAGKVALICPQCHRPTKIGYKLEKKEKFRICRKCQEVI
jgi:large subunit ribosomal protein L24